MSEPSLPARRRDRIRRLIVDVEPLRRDRDFRLLWIGQAVSGLGRQVTAIVLPYQLYVLTGSPLAIGALALVQVVPIMAFSLGGGVVADAVDRRRLLLLTQAGLATASAALAGIALLPATPVLAIYAVAFVAGGLGAIDQPARASSIPRLVPRERLPAAIALNQLNFQAAAVVGPAIGGLVLATFGIAAGYVFDVITFAAAIVALVLIAPIRPTHGAVRPSLAAIAEGLRFARRRRAILGTFVVDLNAMIFGMPTALFPILALDVFRMGPAGLGMLAAAPAAGALVGALLTGWVGRVRRTGRAVLWASAGWGLAITAFGLSTFSFPLALVFLAVAGAADVITAVLRSAIVQLTTPDELRGRVTSIHGLVVTGGPRLGDMEASAVAAIAGAQLSVVSGGLVCLVGLVAIVRSFPELAAFDMRQVTGRAVRPPELVPGPTPVA
jgi:MFS family permease